MTQRGTFNGQLVQSCNAGIGGCQYRDYGIVECGRESGSPSRDCKALLRLTEFIWLCVVITRMYTRHAADNVASRESSYRLPPPD